MKEINLGEFTLDKLEFNCESCKAENSHRIDEDTLNEENFIIECSQCNHPNEFNSKKVIDEFKELALKQVMKAFNLTR